MSLAIRLASSDYRCSLSLSQNSIIIWHFTVEQALVDQRECCGVTYASFLDSGLKLAHCYLFNRLV